MMLHLEVIFIAHVIKYIDHYSCIDIYSYIVVYTHFQTNKNLCSNQEIHMLFEHGFELENT